MRHVVSTSEIPHLWAHKTQTNARNSQGNLYFDGDTIYSYGSHFQIARHVQNKRGENAVLLTTREYSVTTSSHIRAVGSAIPSGLQVFHVDLTANWEPGRSTVDRYNEEIAEHELKAARARKAWSRNYELRRAGQVHAEAIVFCKFYGLRFKVNSLRTDLAEVKRAALADQAHKAAQTKARKAEQLAEYQERINLWLNGEYANLPHGIDTLLRVKNGEVETSRGARFPIEHAKRGLALVESVKASGQAWQKNGHTCHLGHYQIDRIEPNGTVHAGCHVVSWKAIERIKPEIVNA